MFAYTTDTACLNTYFGYSIASIEESTTYVAEFEYASQEAIQKGAGTYSLTPDKLDIDQFITEMNAYINWYVNYSLGNETDETYTSGGYFNKSDSGMTWDAPDGSDFYATTAADFPKDANGKIDQSANIYYKGKVSGISGSDGKTLDAANYLMFEYMFPQHPKAHFRATSSEESAGIVGMSANEMKRFREETC